MVRPSDGMAPKSMAFITCFGPMQDNSYPYCSRFCCAATLKNASLIKECYPDIDSYILYRDIRAFGKGQEEYYGKVRDLGINFVKYPDGDLPEVSEDQKTGNLIIRTRDSLLGIPLEITVDMVVLTEGVVPREDMAELASKLNITRTPDGFFQEVHPKLRPLDTSTDGIYLAGACQGPKDIAESITQASGAASRASIPMARGEVEIEPTIAVINEDVCGGCRICEGVCEYGAIEVEETEEGKPLAKVIEASCKGCGTCGAACPSGAINMRHFTDKQLLEEIRTLFEVVE